jgi:uncharacterized protein
MSYGGEVSVDSGPADGHEGKPRPNGNDPLSAPFWAAVNGSHLLVQKCQGCQRFHQPPVGMCMDCLSTDLAFLPVSGNGHVYSFAVVRDQRQPAFDALTPFVVATIALDDAPGVYLSSNLPTIPIDEVRAGQQVTVFFEEIAPGVRIPQFRPVEESTVT